ncbi:biotin transporter BioY [Alterinioella nitratireducens]|uniref:biotin transporter BioY n=1 Tax=Alterinioella nitratireducens TaxID=2735915 RepID=UPI004059F019
MTVPMWPVQVSLQTLAVFLVGATLGLRLGAATVLVYLAEGAAGLPVFQGTPTQGLGLAYMVGPTGGYLVGFVVMAALAGWAADRGWGRSPLRMGAAMLTGEVVMLALGATWLGVLFGAERAIALGVGPFLLGDLVKLVMAVWIVWGLSGVLRRD